MELAEMEKWKSGELWDHSDTAGGEQIYNRVEWLVNEIKRLTTDNTALTAENTRIFAMVDAREQTIAELTALCDGYRGEGDALRVENGRLREELGEEEHDISLTDKLAMSESVAEQWTRRAEIAESALTRARAEALEEAAVIVASWSWAEVALVGHPALRKIAATIRARAAKGEQ